MREGTRVLKLEDGRQLAWEEYGHPQGTPLFYFHGWPGSRVEAALLAPECLERGVRLISADRPGIGYSDFYADRVIGDWPQDVAALADRLELDRFAVLGLSGGGPYACACARFIPHRLTAALVVSGMGPLDRSDTLDEFGWWNRIVINARRRRPAVLEALFPVASWSMRRFPNTVLRMMHRSMPAVDKPVVARPEFQDMFRNHIREVFRRGSSGAYWDGDLLLNPWGFDVKQIEFPIHLWHGEEDVSVPPDMARRLVRQLPDCHARFQAGEGHLSLIANYLDEIFEVVVPRNDEPDQIALERS